MWNDTGAKTTIWKPFVRLTDDVWVSTQWIEWFGAPHVLSRNPTFISVIREEQSLRKQAPGGRLLPTRLIDAVRQIDPDIGLYDALPGQITPGWSAVTFALDASVDEFEHLHPLVDPQQVQSWWIDDIYVPHSSVWWDECLLSQGGRIYWVAAFTNSVGFAKCTSAG
ncbi:hypothetical protein GN244_ATG17092 [Phytophthora infestans]|uniref:Uncharacterized protein n=1 Tax=Phytophthora infestans TaxID=4787 RepID=A0A833SNV2_PHYIN|nr:hypothetical protein GN244_ATG17092 [Phytophthora infestans]KAF4134829.1 hypothetical protein GN958_ATG16085 [Phytophthora infestans]